MNSHEFTYWQAFDQIEPWGDERRQMAWICATIANVYRRKGAKPFSADDFLPVAPREATPQEIWSAFDLAIAAADCSRSGRRPPDKTERRELLEFEGYHLGSTLPSHLQPNIPEA